MGSLALLGGVAFGVLGWWSWPALTAQEFADLVYQLNYQEANRFLPASSHWKVAKDGIVRIGAEDGTSVVFAANDQPLRFGDYTQFDFFAARRDFTMRPVTAEGKRYTLHFTAERGKVYCRRIEKVIVPFG